MMFLVDLLKSIVGFQETRTRLSYILGSVFFFFPLCVFLISPTTMMHILTSFMEIPTAIQQYAESNNNQFMVWIGIFTIFLGFYLLIMFFIKQILLTIGRLHDMGFSGLWSIAFILKNIVIYLFFIVKYESIIFSMQQYEEMLMVYLIATLPGVIILSIVKGEYNDKIGYHHNT